MSLKDKIMPPLVLTLICVITSALLVAAYNLTYVDTTGIITDKLSDLLHRKIILAYMDTICSCFQSNFHPIVNDERHMIGMA